MLRITADENSASAIRLVAEGRLIGPWVAELEDAIILAEPKAGKVLLDLAEMHFADANGLDLLYKLEARGVILQNVSPFIRELLHNKLP